MCFVIVPFGAFFIWPFPLVFSSVLILLFLNILLARVCWNCTRHQLGTTFHLFFLIFDILFLKNSFKNMRFLVFYQTIDPLISLSFTLFIFFSIRSSDMGLYTEDNKTQLCCGPFTRTSFPSSFHMTMYVLNVANRLF